MLIHSFALHRRRVVVGALLCITTLFFCKGGNGYAQTTASTVAEIPPAEIWVGWLETKAQNLRLVLRFESNDQGKLQGTITSPDQSDTPLSISGATIDSQSNLRFEVIPEGSIGPSYSFEGTMDRALLSGRIQQSGQSLPIVFEKAESLPPEDKDLLGANSAWVGSLEVGTRKVPLRFRFYNEKPYATPENPRFLMDSLAENANGFPVVVAVTETEKIEFSIPAIPGNAKYTATLSEDKTTLAGKFQQGFLPLELIMQRVDALATKDPSQDAVVKYLTAQTIAQKKSEAADSNLMRKEAEPKPLVSSNAIEEKPFVVERFDSRKPLLNELGKRADNSFALSGTITFPKGFDTDSRCPAVVLISGSGPQDRDQTIGKHKPFKQIAEYLASQGMVVLRYDDRGVGSSTGDFTKATTKDFADDALAVWQFARDIEGIDRSRIGLLGHSEGGIIAPMVAAWQREVAFLILIAPPVLPGTEILSGQIDRIAQMQGVGQEDRAVANSLQEELQQIALRFGADDEAALSQVRKAVVQRWDSLKKISESVAVEDQASRQKIVIDAITEQFRGLQSPWMQHFLAYDPSSNWVLFDCPVLSIWAEKDTQVLSEPNLKRLQEIVAHNTNLQVDTLVMPGLNHLLQKANTGLPDEYNQIEQGIEPLALETFSNWLTQREILP